jgi:imidazolonepropionase
LKDDILIHGARQLVTLRGGRQVRRGSAMNDLGVIRDGAVLIRNSIIAAVGPSRQLENLREARGVSKMPANGRVVMPGFCDCLRLMLGGMHAAVRKAHASVLTHDPALMLRTTLLHGTTRAEVKAGGKDAAQELRALRQCLRLDPRGDDLVRTWAARVTADDDPAEFVRSRGIIWEYLRRSNAASFLEIQVDPENYRSAAMLWEAALQRGLARKIFWRGPANQNLMDLISQTSARTVSGITSLAEPMAEKLCKLRTVFVVVANHEILGSSKGALDLRPFLEQGGALALSSGYDPIESPSFNMQTALALAVFGLKLTPEEAIVASTINAAHAMGIGNSAGSIEIGKEADLLLMNVGDYRDIHRQFGANNVAIAIRGGTVVLNRIGWKPEK